MQIYGKLFNNTGVRSVTVKAEITAGKIGLTSEWRQKVHQQFPEYLRQILADQSTAFKINLAFGFILRNNETGELHYYHASSNNHRVLDQPFQVNHHNDIDQLIQTLRDIDFIQCIKLQRPNSKWIIDWVTNVCFYVTKFRDHPIGRPSIIPAFIKRNKAIVKRNKAI